MKKANYANIDCQATRVPGVIWEQKSTLLLNSPRTAKRHSIWTCDSFSYWYLVKQKYELQHDKTNKMTCLPCKDSDQPGHPPSLIRVFAVRMKKAWVLSKPLSAGQWLWSDWVDVKGWSESSLGARHFVGFVILWLISTSHQYWRIT